MNKNTLRNIRDGMGFASYLLVALASVIWVAVAFQKQSLGVGDWPGWVIICLSIFSLLAIILTYKDLGEVLVNSENSDASKNYHLIFSILTVVGYGGGVLIHFKPFIALCVIVLTFVGKKFAKSQLKT
ncbi:hypothetical protein HYO26_23085 [Vibrio parahaemolyticus]|nr:hypothetical protein [Vibrio parahaemolyticus]